MSGLAAALQDDTPPSSHRLRWIAGILALGGLAVVLVKNEAADAVTFAERPFSSEPHPAVIGQAAFEAVAEIDQAPSALPLNFNDAEAVYGSKPVVDILRTLAVLKLCTVRPLVDNADAVLGLLEGLHLTWASNAVVRATFGRQFLAGEDSEQMLATMDHLRRNAICGIPNLSFEMEQGEVVTEELCDQVADRLKDSVRIAALGTPADRVAFTGIKITGIADPKLLADLTTFMAALAKTLAKFDADADGTVTRAEFTAALASMGVSVDGLDLGSKATERLLQSGDAATRLSDGDLSSLRALLVRLDDIVGAGRFQGVRVLLDAEQTYFQPAIDVLYINLARKFNRLADVQHGPRVYNTYQMYLRKSLPKLKRDTRRAAAEGFAMGGKLVRGAYMVTERARAKKLGYADPIQPSKEATDAAYDAGLEFLLEQPTGSKARLFVATHNEDSVQKAVALMAKHGATNVGLDATAHFAQLLGMSDNLTSVLGANGYSAYKYLPYGPMEEVLPYLVRRAQENSSVLGATAHERQMLKQDLRRRIGEAIIR